MIRKWMAKNRHVASGIAIVLTVLGVALIFHFSQPPPKPVSKWPLVYAYDLNTKSTFAVPQNNLPPIRTESGTKPFPQPSGVWARVFACGECTDPAKRIVGWLEKFTPETEKYLQQLLEPMQAGTSDLNPLEALNMWHQEDLLIASPKGGAWVPQTSDEAEAIQSSVRGKCGQGVVLVECRPSEAEAIVLPIQNPMEDLANPSATPKGAPPTGEEPAPEAAPAPEPEPEPKPEPEPEAEPEDHRR